MRTYTGQQKAVIGIAAAALAVLLVLIGTEVARRLREPEEQKQRTLQTIPDAEQSESPGTKKEAYRDSQRAIDSYWDSLPQEEGDEEEETRQSPGSRASALTYDDIVSDTQATGRQSAAPSGRTIRDDPQRQALLKAIAEQEERQRRKDEESGDAAGKEAPVERMEGVQAQVRRSGAISSLDGGEDIGSGFSSLDEGDAVVTGDGHPYKCMFVRDEKVKSGQRVAVRLLEDVVVGGTLVPKNTRLSAVCTIGKRMDVTISTVEINSRIHAVGFEGYDTDGTKGIYCSDLVESGKRAKSQGLSSAGSIIGRRSMVGVARDVANVGLAIAQSASGETTVSIPAGYVFYLVDKKKQ